MGLKLGVIADDFTGATDIAGFLVAGGLKTVQLNGVPLAQALPETDAIVISLKTRSIEPARAVEESLAALRFLQAAGTKQIFFKYCSTFDSTPEGNIGPVTDALMGALGLDFTVVVPALPVNGRTVYHGYLFVGDAPLHESGMRNHPVTPMTDANLMRLMTAQSTGQAGNVPWSRVRRGPAEVSAAMRELADAGVRYAVIDTLDLNDLHTIGAAVLELPLVTGGSGLAAGIAWALDRTDDSPRDRWAPLTGRTIILSGSSSAMTNSQVAAYKELAPSLSVDIDQLIADPEAYQSDVTNWTLDQQDALAPLVYATATPEEVTNVQSKHGAQLAASAIEHFFSRLAVSLAAAGYRRFVVAGGETSGAVTTALGIEGFHVGPQIAPGVPWVRALDESVELALKSGNFGDIDFFVRAQTLDESGLG